MKRRSVVLLLGVALSATTGLTACGEFAYKRGASTAELTVAQEGCRKKGDEDAYQRCMADQGWAIHKLDDWNPLMVVEPTNDGRTGVPVVVKSPVKDSPYATSAPVVANSSGTAVNKNEPPDPMTLFSVSSWWKMGGNANDLQVATNACVAKLGPAHKVVEGSGRFTRGVILCLRDAGWYGLQGTVQ